MGTVAREGNSEFDMLFVGTAASQDRIVAHMATLTGKVVLQEFESFTRRAVVSQNLASLVLEPRGVSARARMKWLEEVDSQMHKHVLDSLYAVVLPEDGFLAARDMVEWAVKQVPVLKLLIQEREALGCGVYAMGNVGNKFSPLSINRMKCWGLCEPFFIQFLVSLDTGHWTVLKH